jgi:hypothetical protein
MTPEQEARLVGLLFDLIDLSHLAELANEKTRTELERVSGRVERPSRPVRQA